MHCFCIFIAFVWPFMTAFVRFLYVDREYTEQKIKDIQINWLQCFCVLAYISNNYKRPFLEAWLYGIHTKCPFLQAQCRAVLADFGSLELINAGWLWKNTIIFSTVSYSLSLAAFINNLCHDTVLPWKTWYRNCWPAFSCLFRLEASTYI